VSASTAKPMRIVVTGSESAGKTTLAGWLAAQLGAECVPEFVRGYAATRGGAIGFEDHGPIAKGQMAVEDAAIARAAAAGAGHVVLDTDLVSTVVYCEHYFGRCPEWIAAEARARLAPLYLLGAPDLPWIADGVRDRGHMREEMHALFREQLERWGARVVELRGSGSERFEQAIRAVRSTFAAGTSSRDSTT
jgi:NadR type nicotinamide-nucleotide adenylyltransferase